MVGKMICSFVQNALLAITTWGNKFHALHVQKL